MRDLRKCSRKDPKGGWTECEEEARSKFMLYTVSGKKVKKCDSEGLKSNDYLLHFGLDLSLIMHTKAS